MAEDLNKLMNEVITNSRNGKLGDAEAICQKIINTDKGNVFAHVNLANILFLKGNVDKALNEYSFALKLKPRDLVIKENMALALISNGMYDEAEKEIKEILDINHSYDSAYNLLGNIYFYKKDFNLAKIYYEKAVELNPRLGDAWSNLGNIYFELKDLDNSEKCYRQAVSINSGNPFWHASLGNILVKQNKLDLAVESYKKALKINPALEEIKGVLYNIYLALGEKLQKEGNLKDAVKFYEKVEASGKGNIYLYDKLVGIKMLLSDYTGAHMLARIGKEKFPSADLSKYPNLSKIKFY